MKHTHKRGQSIDDLKYTKQKNIFLTQEKRTSNQETQI